MYLFQNILVFILIFFHQRQVIILNIILTKGEPTFNPTTQTQIFYFFAHSFCHIYEGLCINLFYLIFQTHFILYTVKIALPW